MTQETGMLAMVAWQAAMVLTMVKQAEMVALWGRPVEVADTAAAVATPHYMVE